MAEESEGPKDLFGDPWVAPRDPRGRKRHRRNPQIAEKVGVLKAAGHTVEAISLRVGLSEPTLRKYYLRELEGGADLAKALLNEKMWEKAMAGNVSAARYVREEFGKGEEREADRSVRSRTPQEPRETPLGKKEERQAAAMLVEGRYATPPAPKLN